MDLIITFFRDVLDGPLYIGIAITCGILICSCIGYLGEQYLNKQKEKKEFEATHTAVAGEIVAVSTFMGAETVGNTNSEQEGVATTAPPVNVAVQPADVDSGVNQEQ